MPQDCKYFTSCHPSPSSPGQRAFQEHKHAQPGGSKQRNSPDNTNKKTLPQKWEEWNGANESWNSLFCWRGLSAFRIAVQRLDSRLQTRTSASAPPLNRSSLE